MTRHWWMMAPWLVGKGSRGGVRCSQIKHWGHSYNLSGAKEILCEIKFYGIARAIGNRCRSAGASSVGDFDRSKWKLRVAQNKGGGVETEDGRDWFCDGTVASRRGRCIVQITVRNVFTVYCLPCICNFELEGVKIVYNASKLGRSEFDSQSINWRWLQ